MRNCCKAWPEIHPRTLTHTRGHCSCGKSGNEDERGWENLRGEQGQEQTQARPQDKHHVKVARAETIKGAQAQQQEKKIRKKKENKAGKKYLPKDNDSRRRK